MFFSRHREFLIMYNTVGDRLASKSHSLQPGVLSIVLAVRTCANEFQVFSGQVFSLKRLQIDAFQINSFSLNDVGLRVV